MVHDVVIRDEPGASDKGERSLRTALLFLIIASYARFSHGALQGEKKSLAITGVPGVQQIEAVEITLPVPEPPFLLSSPDKRYTAFGAVDLYDWESAKFLEAAAALSFFRRGWGWISNSEFAVLEARSGRVWHLPTLSRDHVRGPSPEATAVSVVAGQWLFSETDRGVERFQFRGERSPFPELARGLKEREAESGSLVGCSLELLGSAFNEGWILEGAYYPSDELKRPALLLRPWGFVRSNALDVDRLLRAPEYQTARGETASTPVRAGSQEPLQFPRSNLKVSFSYERGARVGRDSHRYDVTVVLDAVDPEKAIPASVPKTIALGGVVSKDAYVDRVGCVGRIGDELLVALDDRLYRVDIGLGDAKNSDPLRFVLKQSHLVANPDGVTEFKHELAGGEPPYQYRVTGPYGQQKNLICRLMPTEQSPSMGLKRPTGL